MIICGAKSQKVCSQPLFENCPNCGTPGSIDIHVFQKFLHVLWIPFVPVGKTALSHCGHCKQELKLTEMNNDLKQGYSYITAQLKTPLWMFTGLVLVIIAIIASFTANKRDDAININFIQQPKNGDVLAVKTTQDKYTLLKVDVVAGDSIFVRASNYETNVVAGLYILKTKGDSSFSACTIPLPKSALQKMVSNGEIVNIDRR